MVEVAGSVNDLSRIPDNKPLVLRGVTSYGQKAEFTFYPGRFNSIHIRCADGFDLTLKELVTLGCFANKGLCIKEVALELVEVDLQFTMYGAAKKRNQPFIQSTGYKLPLVVAAEVRGLLDPDFIGFVKETFIAGNINGEQ